MFPPSYNVMSNIKSYFRTSFGGSDNTDIIPKKSNRSSILKQLEGVLIIMLIMQLLLFF